MVHGFTAERHSEIGPQGFEALVQRWSANLAIYENTGTPLNYSIVKDFDHRHA